MAQERIGSSGTDLAVSDSTMNTGVEAVASSESFLENIQNIGRVTMLLGEPLSHVIHGSISAVSRRLSVEDASNHYSAEVWLSDPSNPMLRKEVRIQKRGPAPEAYRWEGKLTYADVTYNPNGIITVSVNRFALEHATQSLEDPDVSFRDTQEGWDETTIRKWYDDRTHMLTVSGPPESFGPNTKKFLTTFTRETLEVFKGRGKELLQEILRM